MGYGNKIKVNPGIIALCVYIVAFVIDIILAFALKEKSSILRWLWLPLISLAFATIATVGITSVIESHGAHVFLGWPMIIWGIIRGVVLVVAYFKSLSGFFAIVGAVFLCFFMFIFNAFPFIMAGTLMMNLQEGGSSSGGYSSAGTYSKPTPKNYKGYLDDIDTKGNAKKAYPSQGNLASYFRAYDLPQSGSMYFWHYSPSMSSSYSHSNYTITGTIGIKQQSVDAFHVTSTDMDHYLRSVERDVKEYADKIISRYRRDYPDDNTDFHISINLKITVV